MDFRAMSGPKPVLFLTVEELSDACAPATEGEALCKNISEIALKGIKCAQVTVVFIADL